MTQTDKDSKRRFTTTAMSAAFMLSSYFSVGKRNSEKRSKNKHKKLQQLLCIVGLYGMVLPVIYGIAKNISESPGGSQGQLSPAVQQAQVDTIQKALAAEIRGYEMVLQREPNNVTALEGLASTKLQLKDYLGAIKILQGLVKQYPQRSDYRAMLDEATQKAGQK